MKQLTRRTLIAGIGATVLAPARAQEFPNKPIRLIVPYPPAGASDITARLIAEKLSKKYGTQVVVDNKAGANGVIGTELIARAAPDGYTIGLVASSHVGNP
jgi:tripartite-type tricarboxylate transporter receptor subunit TctC